MPRTFPRKATPEDFEKLLELEAKAYRVLAREFYPSAAIESALRNVPLLTMALLKERHFFVLCLRDGTIVACGGWSQEVHVYSNANMPEQRQPTDAEAIVRAVYVDPAFARQGLATEIMRLIERDARRHGVTRMRLTATLPGLPLYRNLGYADGEDESATLPCGHIIGLLGMTKDLTTPVTLAA